MLFYCLSVFSPKTFDVFATVCLTFWPQFALLKCAVNLLASSVLFLLDLCIWQLFCEIKINTNKSTQSAVNPPAVWLCRLRILLLFWNVLSLLVVIGWGLFLLSLFCRLLEYSDGEKISTHVACWKVYGCLVALNSQIMLVLEKRLVILF